ncbi:MAG: hypothetical protein FWF59_04720 [Turicibacter sp.]|nr:hypothetical protein [Turicibacter sp.]
MGNLKLGKSNLLAMLCILLFVALILGSQSENYSLMQGIGFFGWCGLVGLKGLRCPDWRSIFNLDIKTAEVLKNFNIWEFIFALVVTIFMGTVPAAELLDDRLLTSALFFLTTYRFIAHRMFFILIGEPNE